MASFNFKVEITRLAEPVPALTEEQDSLLQEYLALIAEAAGEMAESMLKGVHKYGLHNLHNDIGYWLEKGLQDHLNSVNFALLLRNVLRKKGLTGGR